MPHIKPKTCHKCGQMYTGWRCPHCYKKSHGSSPRHAPSSSSCRRARGTMTFLSSSPLAAAPTPIWDTDPDTFWGKLVRRVRPERSGDGIQLVTATYGPAGNVRTHTFELSDVRKFVSKYFILQEN